VRYSCAAFNTLTFVTMPVKNALRSSTTSSKMLGLNSQTASTRKRRKVGKILAMGIHGLP
jgi:hypothetical protein